MPLAPRSPLLAPPLWVHRLESVLGGMLRVLRIPGFLRKLRIVQAAVVALIVLSTLRRVTQDLVGTLDLIDDGVLACEPSGALRR